MTFGSLGQLQSKLLDFMVTSLCSISVWTNPGTFVQSGPVLRYYISLSQKEKKKNW